MHDVVIILRWLALGAALAVVVAWLLAYIGCRRIYSTPNQAYLNPWGGDPIVVFIKKSVGCEIVHGISRPGTYFGNNPERVKGYMEVPWWPRNAVTFDFEDYAIRTGWPLPCLAAQHKQICRDAGEDLEFESVRTWGVGWTAEAEWPRCYITLPLLPAWPGILVDGCVFGGCLWALGMVARRLHSARRVRKGLCPKCAYPRGSVGTCSECGTELGPMVLS